MKKYGTAAATLVMVFCVLKMGWAQPEVGNRPEIKSIDEARSIAFTNTVLPVIAGLAVNKLVKDPQVRTAGAALAVYGVMVGPSTGHFYAEDYLRGSLGIAARLGIGSLLLVDSTRELMGKQASESLGWDNKSVGYDDPKLLIGAGLFLGTVAYNFITVKASVEEYNRYPRYSFNIKAAEIYSKTYLALSGRINF